MDFRVLGPLEVSENGRQIDLGGPTQRALLAILLLHASEVVSVERLIDELWDDEPPATAVKTLQAHVSRLRRALDAGEDGRLVTRGQGYVLHVKPGELDADRFRDLLEEGRGRLAEGDPDRAADTLTEALGLWRGPALADLSGSTFARSEIARLEELRLAAIEERVDADLDRGRHATLIPELEHLVARHPLRERLRGQLMLALYRSDRQAEALSAYQDGRRALAEDLGLEPSQSLRRLERQILEQDPALAPPAPRRRPRAVPARRSQRALIAIGALVATIVLVVVIALPAGDGADPRSEAVAAAGAGVHDPRTGVLLTTIPLGSSPENVAVGDGSVWVLDADDATISKIDPRTRERVRTFSIAETPTDLAVGAGALWVGNAFRDARFGNFPRSVSRVDPESGAVEATIGLPRGGAGPYFQGGGFSEQHLAVSDDAVWVVNPDSTVSRIDPGTNRRVATIRGLQALNVAAGADGVWVVEPGGVAEIDPRTNDVARRIEVAAESLTTLAVGADGTLWVADPIGGSVWRIGVAGEPVLRQIPLGLGVAWLALSERGVWVTNPVTDELHLIDPRTNRARVVSRVLGPQHVAVGEGAVWTTALGPPSDRDALPHTCGRPLSGGGSGAPLRIVSDLPLQGSSRELARPMVDAIRLVLERRGFRAGRHRIAYHSCDDSSRQAGGTDIFRCFANAKAYARAVDVVGVIGPFHSFCAAREIPIANQAPRGPLAMIGPTTTFTGLTRPYRETRSHIATELEKLYPERERNFVRIAAGDHATAVAIVKAAKQLGHHRAFVLWDREDPYMAGFAADMRAAARTVGVETIGAATWDPGARRFDGLARRVASARPQAVLLAGAAPRHSGVLIRSLRDRLGAGPALIANDGFAAIDELVATAGRAARGMYVANAGVANRRLPAAGRRFLDELADARAGGSGPDFAAAYAAQAAEILLDAIARSDGTRASVTSELRRTRIEDGILGDIAFDRNGDLLEAPVTLYRIARGGLVPDRIVAVRAGDLR